MAESPREALTLSVPEGVRVAPPEPLGCGTVPEGLWVPEGVTAAVVPAVEGVVEAEPEMELTPLAEMLTEAEREARWLPEALGHWELEKVGRGLCVAWPDRVARSGEGVSVALPGTLAEVVCVAVLLTVPC